MDNGTYRDENKLLVDSRDEELIKEAIERQEYKDKGGKISCGHDFWEKEIDFGDVVFCTRCKQFFVKMKVLPWLTKHNYNHNDNVSYGTNHCEGNWFAPVPPRITD
jgi:hypothetical protein